MMPIFTARRKFDPRCGDYWLGYIEWSGFHHIKELVSTDSILSPSMIEALIDADWEFNVHTDNLVYFFHDFEYLKRRIVYDSSRHNLLAIFERPTQAPAQIEGFTFCGYDILDSADSISVLTNCGRFPLIYTPDDLNPLGLISDLGRVTEIAEAIRKTKADDHHCRDCRVWGIARYTDDN